MIHDLVVAARSLTRRPGFFLSAVLLLALGTGANAAVFAVVRGVLLRPLPFASPERLVAIWPDGFVSNEDIGFWRDRARSLSSVASLASGWLMALDADGGEPVKVTGARVADNLFTVVGARAALGRAIADGDGTPGNQRVAVISDGLWRRRFGADPAVPGRVVRVDDVPHTVIGVMPRGFELLGRETDLWVPLPFVPGSPAQRTTMSRAIGRLRDGVTVEAASRELASLAPQMRRELGRPEDWGRTLSVIGLQEAVTGAARPALLTLLVAVGFVLLLTAANLGTLVLGRSVARAQELAVRTAVGASRGQIVRQLLMEQAVLASVGTAVGLWLAWVAMPLVLSRVPPEIPRQPEIALDGLVFASVIALSMGLAIAVALVPAMTAARPGVQGLLRQRRGNDAPGQRRSLVALVAAQVALALVLGAGAGLMLRSVWNLQQVDPGFDPAGVLTFRLQTTGKYRALATGVPYLRQVTERLEALPGVTAVGAAGHLPMSGYSWMIPVHRAEERPAPGAEVPQAGWRFVWGDYFRAMRMPVSVGRAFTDTDTATSTPVVIVNETLARRFFGEPARALGQRIVQKGGGQPGDTTLEIVGVVGDVRHHGLDEPPPAEIYRPLAQTFMFPVTIVVRTAGAPGALAAAARQAVHEVDAAIPVADLQPLAEVLAGTLSRPRLLALLLSVFAAVGLLLSIVGLYAVVALGVAQREREFGIRLALGAPARRLAAGVVAQGLAYSGAGLLVGLPAALVLARFMESVLFGVTTRDPLTFGVLPVLLAAVTVAACYLPARRAARVDPVVAMNADSR